MRQVELPTACTLGPADGRDRLERWRALHARAQPVARRDGAVLELRYAAVPGGFDELAALAAAEAGCCGFVTWRAWLDGDAPVLTVTSPDGDVTGLDVVAALLMGS